MSTLEGKIREALKILQDAHELSYEYPNPYAGLPSRLTNDLMEAQAWLKLALGETIANDVDKDRGSERMVSVNVTGNVPRPQKAKGEDVE